MLKKVAVLSVFVGVSIAAAGTLKMKEFTSQVPSEGGKDGVATLHYVPGQDITKIHVTITGFEPDIAYGVRILVEPVQPVEPVEPVEPLVLVDTTAEKGILTNNGGNGELNLFTGTDHTNLGPVTVEIYYVDATGKHVVAVGTAK